ncbi:sulfotransferase [Halorhodospira halochloris]|uniref:sulfotransferase n=1 Tax=Halorhodospira halochloris TaxID=1052 RepID=UPI001EE9A6EB|nr:sulfotransferase [Halorhodospira halochloris]
MSARAAGKEPKRSAKQRLQRLIDEERLDAAQELAEELGRKHPHSVLVAYARGVIAGQRERFFDAAEHLQQALERGGRSAELYAQLGIAQYKTDDVRAAERNLQKALSKRGGLAPARTHLALIRRDAGRVDEALELLDRVIESDPAHIPAIYQRASLCSADLPRARLEGLERALKDGQLTVERRALAAFALGKAYWERGEESAAFDVFEHGNQQLYALRRPSRPHPRALIRLWRSVCARDFFQKRRDYGVSDRRQVLVIGQSRTGKSLVESLLCCHPQVVAYGESSMLGRWVYGRIGANPGEQARYARELSAEGSREDAEAFLAAHSLDADRVHIGTMPENLWHLGLFALWFPQVPIIFCKRGLLDHGLSSYFRYYEL